MTRRMLFLFGGAVMAAIWVVGLLALIGFGRQYIGGGPILPSLATPPSDCVAIDGVKEFCVNPGCAFRHTQSGFEMRCPDGLQLTGRQTPATSTNL